MTSGQTPPAAYQGWIENLSAEEILHGRRSFRLPAHVVWGDGMEVHAE